MSLREQMRQDMQLAGLSPATQASYIQAVVRFSRHGRTAFPQRATEKDLADYLIHLQHTTARGTFKVNRYGLVFFFGNTLQRRWPLFQKKYARPGSNVFPKRSNMMAA